MSYLALRVAIFVVVGVFIVLGVRRIWADWTGQFRAMDEARRERDLKERKRPDVIDLKRGPDGTYRPRDEDER